MCYAMLVTRTRFGSGTCPDLALVLLKTLGMV